MNTLATFRNCKTTPYWWEDAPRPRATAETLPRSVDVIVVGSGYTGLSAAIETARGGRSTLVVDAEDLGHGCSSRNGGQVSTSIKPTFEALSGRYNEDLAFRIRREGMTALDWLGSFIERERIDCHWKRHGRFHAAHTRKHYEELAAFSKAQPKGLEVPMEMVPRAEMRSEIGSDLYHGGAVYPAHAGLHPGKYHNGLVDLAARAGAGLVSHCPVTAIARDGAGFEVVTAKGKVKARNVLLATNGYSGPLSPWHRRRVIPIGSYILATEPLPAAEAKALVPKDRMVSDTKRVVVYFRRSPDGSRMLFGGRAALAEKDPLKALPALHALMTKIYPQLAPVPVTHAWVGFVAYTFDTLPHVGVQDGVHFAMGYCGSGVSLASYSGMRMAQQILGKAEGKTALDGLAFPTRPLYGGTPWFLGPSVAVYNVLDRMGV